MYVKDVVDGAAGSVELTPDPPDDSAALSKRLGESDPGGDIKL